MERFVLSESLRHLVMGMMLNEVTVPDPLRKIIEAEQEAFLKQVTNGRTDTDNYAVEQNVWEALSDKLGMEIEWDDPKLREIQSAVREFLYEVKIVLEYKDGEIKAKNIS